MADDLILGRGKLFFAPYILGATTGGARAYFGDTTEVTIAITTQDLDHYSSEAGLKVLDRSVVLSEDTNVTFACDNINEGNMSLWFGASTAAEPVDAPADIGDLIIVGASQSIYGALTYLADNPVGTNRNAWFPYVNLKPNGNFALKGDAWQVMSFTARALKRDNGTERVYWYGAADGSSFAPGDTSPEFDRGSAAVSGGTLATGGTVVADNATPAIDEPFTVHGTLTGGTVAYLFLHDGTSIVGSPRAVSGATWTLNLSSAFKAHLADAYTVKMYSDAAGTTQVGTVTSGTITVS